MPQKAIPKSPRILSVQSHVVSGYCGNKSATFPLQLLGFEVDVVNSVQLSNHTQYKVTKGQIFGSKDLEELHVGLKANGLLKLYDSILSGYVADTRYIESLAQLVKEIKEVRRANNENCIYTFDPVLGDDGLGYYVPGGVEIAEAYKKHLLPLADIITPNRFEASLLSGLEINPKSTNALGQAIEAMQAIHGKFGVNVVVITSLEIELAKGNLVCLVSQNSDFSLGGSKNGTADGGANPPGSIWAISVPKLDCPFTGTGDLFTALLTGWLLKTNFDIRRSLDNTANTIHEILEDTLIWYHQVGDQSVQSQELRLVQNRDKILLPTKRFAANLCTDGNDETKSPSYLIQAQLRSKICGTNDNDTNKVSEIDKVN